jgi:hypothetical protein
MTVLMIHSLGVFERRKAMFVSQEGNLITLINVFETKPQQQQALLEQLNRFAEE